MNVAGLASETHRQLASSRAWIAGSGEQVLEHQMAIASIRSPTFGEEHRASWIADRLAEAGWRVSRDEAGNVVARLAASSEPAVAVCAHLDTVYASEDEPHPVRAGNRVAAPGICDNGRGLAALVALARALRMAGAEGAPVELVATTGEEGAGDLRGARLYVASRRPRAFIALDGAGDERIVNVALGSRRMRVRFGGPGGHSWSSFGAVNPIHAAARCAARLADLPLPGGTALTVARIGGGTSVNALPDDAWFDVDIRGTSESDLAALERQVRAAAEDGARAENATRTGGDALRHAVTPLGHRPCGETPMGDPVVAAAVAATRLVGRRPELCTASTDANAAVAAGIPAIAIGAGGRGGDVHSPREWYDATDATRGVERALTIVATVARAALVA